MALTRTLISTFMKGIGIEFVKHYKNFGTVIDNKFDANCDAVCKKGQQRFSDVPHILCSNSWTFLLESVDGQISSLVAKVTVYCCEL